MPDGEKTIQILLFYLVLFHTSDLLNMPFQSLQHHLESGAKLYVCSINPTNSGAIALLYPLLLLMTHHEKTWLKALP